MARKTKPGYKRCPSCTALVKGTRTKACPSASTNSMGRRSRPPLPNRQRPQQKRRPETPSPSSQVKAVAETVKVVGGYARLNELLGLIKEVGGVKKFKDLVEAIQF